MKSIVRLAACSSFMLCKATGKPVLPEANSTLNEAINSAKIVPYQPTVQTAGMELPEEYDYQRDSNSNVIQYVAFGSGAHRNGTDATNGRPIRFIDPHNGRDTGFYEIVPIVVRPVDNDLTSDQRENYRGRKVLTINNETRICYFFRRIDLSNNTITQSIVTRSQGNNTSIPYKPTQNDLMPKKNRVADKVNTASYIHTTMLVDLGFDETEAGWFQEAMLFWYGSSDSAIISEIALCCGVDKPITKKYPFSGNQIPQKVNSDLKEAVAVQALIMESLDKNISQGSLKVSEQILLGNADPLYGVSNV